MFESAPEICRVLTSSDLTLDGLSERGADPPQEHLVLAVPRMESRVDENLTGV